MQYVVWQKYIITLVRGVFINWQTVTYLILLLVDLLLTQTSLNPRPLASFLVTLPLLLPLLFFHRRHQMSLCSPRCSQIVFHSPFHEQLIHFLRWLGLHAPSVRHFYIIVGVKFNVYNQVLQTSKYIPKLK